MAWIGNQLTLPGNCAARGAGAGLVAGGPPKVPKLGTICAADVPAAIINPAMTGHCKAKTTFTLDRKFIEPPGVTHCCEICEPLN